MQKIKITKNIKKILVSSSFLKNFLQKLLAKNLKLKKRVCDKFRENK